MQWHENFLSVENWLFSMQPNGRAEGESETKDRQKTFLCKLVYQNVFNIGLVQKKGPQGQTRQDPRQISRWPSMLVMVMVMVMMMLVMMIMVVKAKSVTFDSKTLPSYNAFTRRWMGSLAMERAKPMVNTSALYWMLGAEIMLKVNTAPRRGWDQAKRGLRPISRYGRHFFVIRIVSDKAKQGR